MEEPKINSYTLEELTKKCFEHQAELEKLCRIEEQWIIFNIGSEYRVPLKECNTPTKILRWVDHLCEKTWMTTELMRRFILLARHHHKIDIYGNS